MKNQCVYCELGSKIYIMREFARSFMIKVLNMFVYVCFDFVRGLREVRPIAKQQKIFRSKKRQHLNL